MNITRHLYLTTAVRAPDDGGAVPNPAEATAPEAVSVDPPAAAEPPAPDQPSAEVPPAPVEKPAPTIPMSVFQRRVGEETSRRQAEERRRGEAETKAANLQAIIDRLQSERAAPDPGADPARAPATRAAAPAEQPNLEEAVRKVVDEREATKSINDVVSKGVQEFTAAEWQEKSEILAALGAATPEFVQDVIAVDPTNAHRIIFALANDPGKAADLASMNVRQRTAELTRMSMAEQAKNPPATKTDPAPTVVKTTVSKAPAPTTVPRAHAEGGEIDPTTPDGNEKMSDEQWAKWFKETGEKKLYRRA